LAVYGCQSGLPQSEIQRLQKAETTLTAKVSQLEAKITESDKTLGKCGEVLKQSYQGMIAGGSLVLVLPAHMLARDMQQQRALHSLLLRDKTLEAYMLATALLLDSRKESENMLKTIEAARGVVSPDAYLEAKSILEKENAALAAYLAKNVQDSRSERYPRLR
jgi:hypothetical protein